jgi:DNA invertase Pin-like site-specific DNA recombinase
VDNKSVRNQMRKIG